MKVTVSDIRRALYDLTCITVGLRTPQDREDIRMLCRAIEILTGERPNIPSGPKRRPCCYLADREAWVLRCRDRLSYEEIGARMGETHERVRQRIIRYERTAIGKD
jgi:hypothetical protein